MAQAAATVEQVDVVESRVWWSRPRNPRPGVDSLPHAAGVVPGRCDQQTAEARVVKACSEGGETVGRGCFLILSARGPAHRPWCGFHVLVGGANHVDRPLVGAKKRRKGSGQWSEWKRGGGGGSEGRG